MSPNASSAPRMSVRVTKRRSVLPSTSISSDTRPMAMPATGAFSGTPAFNSDSVDAHTEPIDVEPSEPSASDTCWMAIRELLDAGQHGHQRPLGQRVVPDLATLGRTDATGLAGRIRREVVVI